MSVFKLTRTDDREMVAALHTLCMPDDDFDLDGQLWVVYDETNTPVAFCAARLLSDENSVFLNRAGVLPCANGHHLQRRMIHARIKWAKQMGATCALTYCLYENHASIVNLLKTGFAFYCPSWRWAGAVHYFKKEL